VVALLSQVVVCVCVLSLEGCCGCFVITGCRVCVCEEEITTTTQKEGRK
jgi:hypothetical protein